MSARVQSASIPHLVVVHLQCPPEFHTSTSQRLHHDSRAPDLHTSLPPHLRACSAPPDPYTLYTSTSTRLQCTSRLPCLQVCTSTSTPPYLLASTSASPQHARPKLQVSIPLHLYVSRPAACLPSSRSPYLYTSTFPGLQHASRALETKRQHVSSEPGNTTRRGRGRPVVAASKN